MAEPYSITGTPSDLLSSAIVGKRRYKVSDEALEIARGDVDGSQSFGAYGKKVTAGAEATNLLWANGAWYIPNQTVGEQIRIVSTSAEDGIAGTGIRSVHVHYLDANLDIQSEEVVLNGTTPVLTVATNIRFIECGHIDTFGSTKKSVGTITFTNLANTKTYNQIDTLETRCSSSLRMIPRGKRGVIVGLVGSSISGTASAGTLVSIGVSYFQGHDYTADEILIPTGTVGIQDSAVPYNLPIPLIIPEGTLVGMLCSTDKAATITGDWFGWIEDV